MDYNKAIDRWKRKLEKAKTLYNSKKTESNLDEIEYCRLNIEAIKELADEKRKAKKLKF